MLVFKHEFREAICCIYIQSSDSPLFMRLAHEMQKDQTLARDSEILQKSSLFSDALLKNKTSFYDLLNT